MVSNPGWPLRNLLAYLHVNHASASYRILCWRDTELPSSEGTWKSRFGVLTTAAPKGSDAKVKPTAVGWEKNVVGKLGARVADLAPMMDPKR